MEKQTPSSTVETLHNKELNREEAQSDMAQVVLFRVMNLDHHPGVQSVGENGEITYTPDNQQYPDQGDFAFSGPQAFDVAVTRAYPNYVGNVHMLHVDQEHVVAPHPDDMPGVVYVKNGANVIARKVPREVVDEHIARISANQEPYTSEDIVQRMSAEADK